MSDKVADRLKKSKKSMDTLEDELGGSPKRLRALHDAVDKMKQHGYVREGQDGKLYLTDQGKYHDYWSRLPMWAWPD